MEADVEAQAATAAFARQVQAAAAWARIGRGRHVRRVEVAERKLARVDRMGGQPKTRGFRACAIARVADWILNARPQDVVHDDGRAS